MEKAPTHCSCGGTEGLKKIRNFIRAYCPECVERNLCQLPQSHRCLECDWQFWCMECRDSVQLCPSAIAICGICSNRCGCNKCREEHPDRIRRPRPEGEEDEEEFEE